MSYPLDLVIPLTGRNAHYELFELIRTNRNRLCAVLDVQNRADGTTRGHDFIAVFKAPPGHFPTEPSTYILAQWAVESFDANYQGAGPQIYNEINEFLHQNNIQISVVSVDNHVFADIPEDDFTAFDWRLSAVQTWFQNIWNIAHLDC